MRLIESVDSMVARFWSLILNLYCRLTGKSNFALARLAAWLTVPAIFSQTLTLHQPGLSWTVRLMAAVIYTGFWIGMAVKVVLRRISQREYYSHHLDGTLPTSDTQARFLRVPLALLSPILFLVGFRWAAAGIELATATSYFIDDVKPGKRSWIGATKAKIKSVQVRGTRLPVSHPSPS
jgi:hypothetical protein